MSVNITLYSGVWEGVSQPDDPSKDPTSWSNTIIKFNDRTTDDNILDIIGYGISNFHGESINFNLTGEINKISYEFILFKTNTGKYNHTIQYKGKFIPEQATLTGKFIGGILYLRRADNLMGRDELYRRIGDAFSSTCKSSRKLKNEDIFYIISLHFNINEFPVDLHASDNRIKQCIDYALQKGTLLHGVTVWESKDDSMYYIPGFIAKDNATRALNYAIYPNGYPVGYPVGTFIIRISDTQNGFSIAFIPPVNRIVTHLLINRLDNGKFEYDGSKYDTLTHAINGCKLISQILCINIENNNLQLGRVYPKKDVFPISSNFSVQHPWADTIELAKQRNKNRRGAVSAAEPGSSISPLPNTEPGASSQSFFKALASTGGARKTRRKRAAKKSRRKHRR